MYTSGTESRPKGVMLSSRSLIAQYVSCVVDGGMSADDVELHSLPLYHCAQLDCFFSVDVYLGATSIILPGPDPAAILATIEPRAGHQAVLPADGVDLAAAAPRLRHHRPVQPAQGLLRRLADAGRGAPGDAAPAARRAAVELLRPDRDGAAGHDPAARTSSWRTPARPGRAALNVETHARRRRRQAGARRARSARSCTAARTRRWATTSDEEKTAEAFRGGWFHSGDLGVMTRTATSRVVDRKKDMIKTGGENVASREVEEAIYELDGVAEVAVFGISHPRWVEAVAAVVVPKPGVDAHRRATSTPTPAARLAGYKRPKYVVLADALPKNPSGKILKRELRERARRPGARTPYLRRAVAVASARGETHGDEVDRRSSAARSCCRARPGRRDRAGAGRLRRAARRRSRFERVRRPAAAVAHPVHLPQRHLDPAGHRRLREAGAGGTVDLFRAPTGELNARVAADARSGGLRADVIWGCDPLTMQAFVDQHLVGGWTPADARRDPGGVPHRRLRRRPRALPGRGAPDRRPGPATWSDLAGPAYSGGGGARPDGGRLGARRARLVRRAAGLRRGLLPPSSSTPAPCR